MSLPQFLIQWGDYVSVETWHESSLVSLLVPKYRFEILDQYLRKQLRNQHPHALQISSG